LTGPSYHDHSVRPGPHNEAGSGLVIWPQPQR